MAAFGRGECFMERYLERARHVETQCLADRYGNVVVVSTRDCSLQRRHQKLVEEAPAPFLTAEQNAELYRASKEILRQAGYVGAGTCEFLVAADGTLSFLEVNARLQVEHPVSEEVTGVDLVREMFRIAEGEPLGYTDPSPRGHSIEFRVNCEDPGRGFLPAPGVVTEFTAPGGGGVRVDTGVEAGSLIGPAWDSMLAKLIVTGATRGQALRRAARALKEFQVGGLATTLPFHRAVVADPAFAPEDPAQPFRVHTGWIENEFHNDIPPYEGSGPPDEAQQPAWESLVVEVGGRRVEVSLPPPARAVPEAAGAGTRRLRRAPARGTGVPASGDRLVSPMQGTVVKVAVDEGQHVEQGQLVLVMEAMKMEQSITAHRKGFVRDLVATAGAGLVAGATVCRIEEIADVSANRSRQLG
jgi:acetyl-CoA/propionyl-CoA carboxylase biotin carboxyl carrier protein